MLREKVKSLESALEAKSSTTKVTRKSREKPPEPIETKTIDELRRIELIGKGAQSSVYKVARDEYLALKEIDMPDPEEEEEKNDEFSNAFVKMKKLLQEIEIINHLDHPNIIKGYGICFGDESHLPSILIEYCPKNLNEAIKDMDDIKRVTTVFEICLAMSAVHEAHIIHRNLKPENILIDCEDHVKISDFGMSRLEDFEMCMSSKTAGVGSLKFKAPEVLNESTSYNEKVDVYSFGVILYFILTRGSFPKINIIDIGLGKKAQIPKCVNELSRNLINQCWSTDPDDRPSFSELVEIIKENKFKLIDGVEKEITYIVQFLSL